ncbi:MAG TPA: uracil-DNA glycosylase [Candidatus Edwardsbacteria bacterium]|nr:uracil-DNA glycosylase [Candidatus Edwardsbacteria bacterium]
MRRYLYQLLEQGEHELPIKLATPPRSAVSQVIPARAALPQAAPKEKVVLGRPVIPASSGNKAVELETFRAEICNCQQCALGKRRKKFVFGDGDPDAKIVFVGEAPGEEEDNQGRPFVGAAGQLLTKIIEAIKFRRDEVFICNILKCRPPGNRDPEPGEVAACEPYLIRQLDIIQPVAICALGKHAAQTLLKTLVPISKLRGQVHYYHDIKLIPTFHPAALLRNPSWKRQTWEDVQLLRKVYDQEIAKCRNA